MPKPRQQAPAEKLKTQKPVPKQTASRGPETAPASAQHLATDPAATSPQALLRLQRQVGNRAVRRLMGRSRRAEAPEAVQREAPVGLEGGPVGGELEGKLNSARGGGRPLDQAVGRKMGSALKADLSGVRVHTDSQSAELNRSLSAKAFTYGRDVFFSEGAYNPGTQSGEKLLAHELTHVVQQGAAAPAAKHGGNKVQAKLTVGPANDPHEQEADRVAEQVVAPQEEPEVQRQAEGPHIQRKLMSSQDFVAATSTRRRGGYIKLVDKALQQYEADKTPAKLTALRFAVEKYIATKGDGDSEKQKAAGALLGQVMAEERELGPQSQLEGLLPYQNELMALAEKGKILKNLDGKLRGVDRFLRETLKTAILQSSQDPETLSQSVQALNLLGNPNDQQKQAITQLIKQLTKGQTPGAVAIYHSLYARCMEVASLMFSEHEHQNDFSDTLGNNKQLKELVKPIVEVTRVFSEALDLSFARKLGQQRGVAQAEITNDQRSSFEVKVIGAGPVGMLAAIEAYLAGANVHVFEMRRTGPTRANVLKLTAASMHKLRRVGVYGDLFGPDSPKGSDSLQQGQAVSVGLLEDVLRAKAAQLGIPVTYGYQLETITAPDQEGGRTTVRLKKYVPTRPGPEMDLYNKIKGQPDVIDARSDLVIGATGAGGTTRQKLGLESERVEGKEGEEYIDFTAVGIFAGDGGTTNAPTGDKEREGAWVVGLRTPAVDYLLTQITRDQFLKFKDDTGGRNTWVSERGRKLAGYTGALKQSSVFDITLNQAREFVNKEASGVVIGDEAATPHPLTGSGFNTGAASTNLVPGLVRGLGTGQRDQAYKQFSTGVKNRTDLMVGKGTKFFEKNIDKLTKMNKPPEPERRGYSPEDIGVTEETSLQYELAQKRVMALYGMDTGINAYNLEQYGPDYQDPEKAYQEAQRKIEALFNIPRIKEDKL